jgi:vitamin B12 transporter
MRHPTPRCSRAASARAQGAVVRPSVVAVSAALYLSAAAEADAQPAADVLEEVIVTSSIVETPRRQIGTAVSVISGAEIELRGYNSLADVLRTQPGIGVSNSGGPGQTTALRIRGEEAYRTVLYIDGVKAVDPAGAQVAPSFDSLLTTGDLARIEVLRGPQGFMYGADAGGVVNVLTRTGEGDLGGRVGVEYGNFATRKLDASLAGGGETGDYFVAVTDLATDGFNAQTADTLLRDKDSAENTTLHTKLGWHATENLRLQLVARNIDASVLFDGCGFPTTHDCRGTTDQSTYRLSADYATARFGNVVAYSDTDILRNSYADGAVAFAADGELSRFEYIGSFQPSDATTLVYGVDLQTEKVAGGEALEREQDGYYFEYQRDFGDAFFLSAGARYDDNEDFGTHTSLRISGAYVQDLAGGASLKYRASYGTGFRPPSPYEIAFNRGSLASPPASSVTLKEESSQGYDIGLDYVTAGGLRFDLTWFDQDIEDEIFFDPVSWSGYLQSSGRSTSKGVEAGFEMPLSSRWALTANWTYNDAKNTTNEQRLRRPKSLGNVGFSFASADGRLRLLTNYRLSMSSIDFGEVTLDDYGVLDVALSYSASDKLEVYGRVENGLDEDYQEVFGYNTAGRSAYGGVRLSF